MRNKPEIQTRSLLTVSPSVRSISTAPHNVVQQYRDQLYSNTKILKKQC